MPNQVLSGLRVQVPDDEIALECASMDNYFVQTRKDSDELALKQDESRSTLRLVFLHGTELWKE